MIKDKPEKRVWVRSFSSPDEYQSFRQDLEDSRLFDLRYRGVLEFYGKGLISYWRDKLVKSSGPSRKSGLDFLRIFGYYFTDHLEDNCPESWQDCGSSFWEEFIFVYYPYQMKLGSGAKIDIFLRQLNIFVEWLDDRIGTSWYPVVKEMTHEASGPLKACSYSLDNLLLSHFPRIHSLDWDYQQDLDKIEDNLKNFQEVKHTVFKWICKKNDLAVLKDLDWLESFNIQGLSAISAFPGMLLHGSIGRRRDELLWEWAYTEGTYPERAEKYMIG